VPEKAFIGMSARAHACQLCTESTKTPVNRPFRICLGTSRPPVRPCIPIPVTSFRNSVDTDISSVNHVVILVSEKNVEFVGVKFSGPKKNTTVDRKW